MKKKTFTFDSGNIGSKRFIHFHSNPEIQFSEETTRVFAFNNKSKAAYFAGSVEKYIVQLNQHDSTYFNIPIPLNCSHLEIKLHAMTDYDIDAIEAHAQ